MEEHGQSSSDNSGDSEFQFRELPPSRNNKPRRPEVEKCMLCDKEVRKMRDHLSNKHRLTNDDKLRKFISTYHTTFGTVRCYQCEVCSVRFADRAKHAKDHVIERIHERKNITHSPTNILVAVTQFRNQLLLPYREIVDFWVNHERGLFDDGDTSGTWNVSSTQFAFLCRAIEATLYFEEPSIFKFMFAST